MGGWPFFVFALLGMVMVGIDGIVKILREPGLERLVVLSKSLVSDIHIRERGVHLGVAGVKPLVNGEPAGLCRRAGLITRSGMTGAFGLNHRLG